MVKKALAFVGREIQGLHEAAYLLAFSAFLSMLLALIRDRLFAHEFGAGEILDLYYAAFRVPDALFVTVSSLVSTSILVPFLLRSLSEGDNVLRRSIDNLFSAFFGLIVAVAIALSVFMPQILGVLFPEIATGAFADEFIDISRVIMLSPIFLGVSNFLASITQMRGRFAIYAISPLLYNIGIIIGIVALYPIYGIVGLGIGVALGAFLHMAIQVPFVQRDGLLPHLRLSLSWSTIREVSLVSLPRTLTLSSQQILILVFTSFASFIGAGAISVFNLSQNLQSVPLSLIGVSYSAAAFPILARAITENNKKLFIERTIQAARHIIFWSIPLSILFIVLRAQIVRTAFGSGEFDWSDTRLVAASLALFIVSATAQGLILLFVRAFYAEGNTRTPLLLNSISLFLSIAAAFFLIRIYNGYPVFGYFVESIMKTEDISGSIVLMLPLAFSLGAIVNALLHWRALSSEFSEFTRSMIRAIWQSLSSAIVGGFLAYQSLKVFDDVFDLSTGPGIFLQGLSSGIVGIIATALLLALLKNPEFSQVISVVRAKVWERAERAPLADSGDPHLQ